MLIESIATGESCIMPTRNVNLTRELEDFVVANVESGRFENASEVVRAGLRSLEREEQLHRAKVDALRTAIDEGDASGIARGDVFAQVRKTLRLPAPRR
jgi:antitoxin ParD1/3/4